MRTNLTFNQTLSGNRSLILRRLLVLRGALLVTVVMALAGYSFFLDGRLELGVYLLPVAGVLFSVYSGWLLKHDRSISDANLLRQLCFDALFLLVLIHFTGGATNPFIYYLLVLVAISAAIFNSLIAWLYSAGCMLAYTFMMFNGIREHLHHMESNFQLHLLGMWVNFVGSAVLICFFVSRLATALRDRQIELSQAREETLKNEQLVGIGTLAASTVHALGTPLSTMAVLLGEMKADSNSGMQSGMSKGGQSGTSNEEYEENITLMLSQIERCKRTLGKLSLLSQQQESAMELEPVDEFVSELKEHYLLANPKIMPKIILSSGSVEGQSALEKSVLLRHAIINLIDNAIQAARSTVEVSVKRIVDHRSGESVCFEIKDDGDGLPSDVAAHWGKPVASNKESGMGIGIFLSNSTVEKLGGKVQLRRAGSKAASKEIEKGTIVDVTLPLRSQLAEKPLSTAMVP